MAETNIVITCINCGKSISVDEALTQQIQERFKQEFEGEYNQKEQAVIEREQRLMGQMQALEENQKQLEESKRSIDAQVETRLVESKKIIEKQAMAEAIASQSEELKMLQTQLQEKEIKLNEARTAELEIRKQKNDLEEDKKSFELEKQRQLDAEREKIRTEALKLAEDEHRLKDAEKDKKLQDAIRANEDMRRKLEQGSQQTQGEVLELELENLLKASFPYDEIIPVAKGINGADVLQKVKDRNGNSCGIIAWESKHTKAWSEGWVAKLKDDQRKAKAELAVLVSRVLPQPVTSFASMDDIWVTSFECVLPLANTLRLQLIQMTSVRASTEGKNEKMEVVYNYLCGTEFKHKVQAIVEAFAGLQDELEKEKRAYSRIWATREKQIQRVMENTTGMYGDLQGLIGTSMPVITELDMPLLEPTVNEVSASVQNTSTLGF